MFRLSMERLKGCLLNENEKIARYTNSERDAKD